MNCCILNTFPLVIILPFIIPILSYTKHVKTKKYFKKLVLKIVRYHFDKKLIVKLIDTKTLRIMFGKVVEFIRDYNGTKYLVLFGSE